MDVLSWNLLLAAIGIAVVHTALGPDHYLPFVMIGRARRWSLARTLGITALCGLGHVASSLLLGAVGIAAGMAIAGVENVEGIRGDAAAWALLAGGCAYALWGLRRALRNRGGLEPHEHGGHVHVHQGGQRQHQHGPSESESAEHEAPESGPNVTFWALFLVFVLGPCEPLIPLFVAPVSRGRWDVALITGLAFAVATIGTMLGLTAALHAGVARLPFGPLERWSHAMAGSVIALSGAGILFLGL